MTPERQEIIEKLKEEVERLNKRLLEEIKLKKKYMEKHYKYKDFYVAHWTNVFWEEVTPSNDKRTRNLKECARCWFRDFIVPTLI